MKIQRIETFCDPFVGFVRVTADDGAARLGTGLALQRRHHVRRSCTGRSAPWSLGQDAFDDRRAGRSHRRARAQVPGLVPVPRDRRRRHRAVGPARQARRQERLRAAGRHAAAVARRRYEPGNLCSRSTMRSISASIANASCPSDHGATCRCRIVDVMSALYGETCPSLPHRRRRSPARNRRTDRSTSRSSGSSSVRSTWGRASAGLDAGSRLIIRHKWTGRQGHFEHSVIPFWPFPRG